MSLVDRNVHLEVMRHPPPGIWLHNECDTPPDTLLLSSRAANGVWERRELSLTEPVWNNERQATKVVWGGGVYKEIDQLYIKITLKNPHI